MAMRRPYQLRLPLFTKTPPPEKGKPLPRKKSTSLDNPPAIEVYQTTLQGYPVSYTLKRSRKARLVRLEFAPGAGLVVVAPVSCCIERIQHLLECKSRWILDKLTRYHACMTETDGDLKEGDTVPYLGKRLKIEVMSDNGSRGHIYLSENKLIIAGGRRLDSLNPVIERWYRAVAAAILREKVDKYSHRMAVEYNRIYLKGQKTLWGSCSRKRNLNFNWRLLMTPEPVIDYVVVHELAHLKEMNHTGRFWRIVARHCPDWQQHRKWLRDHAIELNNILKV
jgi:predicted metal-dependent hydrolase